MSKTSRRISRMCLVQMLYSRYFLSDNQSRELFLDTFFVTKYRLQLDNEYIDNVMSWALNNSWIIAWIITKFAPRFTLNTIPTIHIAILATAISEMFFIDENIPKKVILNEAIELAKKYSDTKWKKFINWLLHKVLLLSDNEIRELKQDIKLF